MQLPWMTDIVSAKLPQRLPVVLTKNSRTPIFSTGQPKNHMLHFYGLLRLFSLGGYLSQMDVLDFAFF
jgi:hypothetical protein